MKKELLQQLKEINEIEQKQITQHSFINDYQEKSLIQTEMSVPIFTSDFFKGNSIYVGKHNRFFAYPKHTHTFLEMNYMLSGSAQEIVNGQPIQLKTGDILLLGVGTTHSISALGKDDILINIIFRNDIFFSLENLKAMGQNQNVLSGFIMTNNSENFMIYRKKHTENAIRKVADLLIEEYYSHSDFSDKLIDSYLNSLLILFSRNTDFHSTRNLKENTPDVVLALLKQITTNSAQVSLSEFAQKNNYSRAYLGSLFKKVVGKSFSDVLTEERLLEAYNLLNSTNYSISEIIEKIGISNKTFFYKKFKEKFHCMPSEIR
ncbi:AraC-like DNA-binding protein/mannose-6-phosphate isomerase-like protein (cupin superfamily) [Lactobacillus colini]|uniref:AraC-like DNA-binding protein/mannose-6-phosphate isomerase-like protein (Cupin superfamily) n=1 Tax=Lactobacillus colini TaxID=1819254 RepID=A0ABS4MBV3_9LACO|nr:helix-turn-helix domain-containing protein [Lactobacillus colini]MBP2057140.1 AraC-like DNA-binding protein/mannose-6-phosphate isomerase-like protein (cupin superfamily) [Lactobacillus colini]